MIRLACIALSPTCIAASAVGQVNSVAGGPTDEKAKKTYEKALEDLHERTPNFALDNFKKADKQDDGRCLACQKQMFKLGMVLGDWKAAELGAEELIAGAPEDKERALAHHQYAVVLIDEGVPIAEAILTEAGSWDQNTETKPCCS